MTDCTKLRELAQAATPGLWYTDDHLGDPERNIITVPTYEEFKRRLRDGEANEEDMTIAADFEDYRGAIWKTEDAEFIAAANPTVVLALLDELRDAKAQALRETAGRYRVKAKALIELPNLDKSLFHMYIATLLDLADELDRMVSDT